jgi:hypothetical protein
MIRASVDQMRLRWHQALVICFAASFLVLTVPTASSAGVEKQLWAKRYDGPGKADDRAGSVAVSPDGKRVFVTGASIGSSSGYDWATIAYDASTGDWLWVKRLNGPGNGTDTPSSLGVSPDGITIFVTGSIRVGPNDLDYTTIAYAASTGARLWVARYNGPASNEDFASSLSVSPDGTRVFVTGGSVHGEINLDYATIAYDASTGAQLWVKRYNGEGNDFDDAIAIEASPDGSRVFVTGQSEGSSTYSDYATIGYDAATGAQLWVKRYNGQGKFFDDVSSLIVSPDGSKVYVTGGSTGSSSLFDYATVAYDASTGAQLWAKRYEGPAKGFDYAWSVQASPDGTKVFVTGTSEGVTSLDDYFTIAYDASTGAWLWAKRYNGEGGTFDFANALAVSPDGSQVFVTGGSQNSSANSAYATVAYDASTGHQVWAKRYNSKGNDDDNAEAVAVSPDGLRVFVTGLSIGSGITDNDYATLAYSMS